MLFWLLTPIVVALASLALWSGHFEAVFQGDDAHIILKNRALQDTGNIPHYFTTPLLYADQPERAEYRPLALVSLALDNWLAKPINAAVFEADAFAWFLLGALLFGAVCLFLPGGDRGLATTALALFAFHPLVGEALNYVSRRGDLIGAVGVVGGLLFWIVWPAHLPAEVLHWDKNWVPKTDSDDRKRRWAPIVNAKYRAFVEAELYFYLIPVVLGMLADPAAAIFPLLLLAWIVLFDRNPKKKTWRRVLPSALVCGVYWILQLVFTWKYGEGYRIPALAWWWTQPWVVLRYLGDFLAPLRLVPESGLRAFPHPWEPLALAGFAGLAALVALAVRLGKTASWRIVSFGLWWFLIALSPTILVPRRIVEADYRMYLPLMGLALATGAAAWQAYRRALAVSRSSLQVHAVAAAAAALVLAFCCWQTVERNLIWQSQTALWEDVIAKNPFDGRAFVARALALLQEDQSDLAYADLTHAASLMPSPPSAQDAPDEISLAEAFDRMNKDKEAQDHFQRAIEAAPNYSSAWSSWSHWLIAHRQFPQAFEAASRAVKLSPWNVEAQHTLLDYYSADSNWPELRKGAENLLRVDPTDADARRALEVADAGFTALRNAEAKAKNKPTVDDFLALSVQYYQARRYQDVIAACNSALKLNPELAEAYHNMAAAYHALGRNDEAIHALREAIRIRPDLAIAKSNLQFLLLQKEEDQRTPVSSRP